jgi:hypothetical protein
LLLFVVGYSMEPSAEDGDPPPQNAEEGVNLNAFAIQQVMAPSSVNFNAVQQPVNLFANYPLLHQPSPTVEGSLGRNSVPPGLQLPGCCRHSQQLPMTHNTQSCRRECLPQLRIIWAENGAGNKTPNGAGNKKPQGQEEAMITSTAKEIPKSF